jgi:8-oxo-dGTP pyrophosphatase MutT (NUDIX family)
VASFRQVGEETVHDGHIIRVAVGTYEGPDGDTFTRDVVHHPGAVAVLPLHSDGTVTLVRQYRAPIDAQLLEIPAGIRDVEGEPTETTAARELAEEVGLEADRLEHLVTFHNSPGMCDEVVDVYLATGLRSIDADAQGPEEQAMTVERHHVDDLAAMIADGSLTDAKTVIAVALVRAR